MRLLTLLLLAACAGGDKDTADDTGSCTLTDWYLDADADGYGLAAERVSACAAPAGYIATAGDCDDGDAAVNPEGTEVCGGGDEDCNGLANDADPAVQGRSYAWRDADEDGHGNPAVGAELCTLPAGYITNSDDCDDDNAAVHPGAPEVCDGIDDNCDTLVDDEDPAIEGQGHWSRDADEDGYGDDHEVVLSCEQPDGYVENADDCDDTSADVSPVIVEICDTIDNDCDSLVDDEDPEVIGRTIWYTDADEDTFGLSADFVVACWQPTATSTVGGDCDDTDARRYPGNPEVCDGVDNDCDTTVDTEDPSWDSTTGISVYPDTDADGYGGTRRVEVVCEIPEGYILDGSDCDDHDAAVNPDAWERCGDGEDSDCSGVDEACDSLASADALLLGTTGDDAAGASVAGAGDFDGDGQIDLVIGALTAHRTFNQETGAAYLVRGPIGGTLALADAEGQLWGEADGDAVGMALAAGEDLDGDGFADVAVAAPGYGANGAVAILRGGTFASVSLTGADALVTGERSGDEFGEALVLAGDLDGDGRSDLVASAPGTGVIHPDAGALYVWTSPPSGAVGASSATAKLSSATDYEHLGAGLGAPGDLDGDGIADLAILTAPDAGTPSVYVLLGPVTGSATLAGLPAWTAEATGSLSGARVASVGDLDGDGLADLVVGDPTESTTGADAGSVYILPGPATGGGSVGTAPLILRGEAVHDRVGAAIVSPGDLDLDGSPELLLGGFGEHTVGSGAGAVFLVPGGLSGVVSVGDVAQITTGVNPEDNAGYSLATVGDLDGDGGMDWLVGAPGRSSGGSSAGYAALVRGP